MAAFSYNNNNNIRNWPLPIGAFQDQCKQIVINKHNMVKNPNWRGADQLAIYKRRREVEPRGYREQHQLAVRTGFEPATYGFQIRRSNHSATLPPLFMAGPRQRGENDYSDLSFFFCCFEFSSKLP